MLRRLFSKLSSSVEESPSLRRRNAKVPIKIWLEPRRSTGALECSGKILNTFGETKTLTAEEMAFIVPSIRIHDNYLVGDDRVLNVEVDLPVGRVRMKCVGRRYERIEGAGGSCKYLVGVKILNIPLEQRASYEDFVNESVSVVQSGLLRVGEDRG